jgi:uncharacterized membrane protein (UPF0182 family)
VAVHMWSQARLAVVCGVWLVVVPVLLWAAVRAVVSYRIRRAPSGAPFYTAIHLSSPAILFLWIVPPLALIVWWVVARTPSNGR